MAKFDMRLPGNAKEVVDTYLEKMKDVVGASSSICRMYCKSSEKGAPEYYFDTKFIKGQRVRGRSEICVLKYSPENGQDQGWGIVFEKNFGYGSDDNTAKIADIVDKAKGCVIDAVNG